MGSEWRKIPLGNLIALQRGHDLPSQYREAGHVPIMGSSGLTGFHSKPKCKGPGVVVGRSGNSMGVVNYCDVDYWPLNTALYVTNFKGNNERYIYYLLSQIDFDQFNSGSAQKSLNRNAVSPYEVWATEDKHEQKRIGRILEILEHKIELNRQINQTLEEMAQALFKSWFVDFDPVIDNALAAGKPIPEELQARAQRRQQQLAKPDHQPLPDDVRQLFPSEFEETEALGWVPKGWEVSNIKSFGRVVTGKTPPKSVEGAYDEVGFPFITPTDIDDSIFVVKVNRYLSDEGAFVINKNKILKGSVCVTCIGSQMGKTVISPTDAYTNQQINSVVMRDDSSRNYLFYNLRGRRDEIFSLGASGSTMPILNKSSFENLLVLRPSDRILRKYQEFTSEQMEGVLQRFIQIESLECIRDTLLPKLISGELRLPESMLDSETNPPAETAYE
ncbi:restriction endonuclease subunit S [Amphritea sp.]|uniref:restriction endonuclease subunit S n=1 Tax=Amphritea sp. TaxID=1872502 RepID=UPI003A918579